jgi:hypothetical protein
MKKKHVRLTPELEQRYREWLKAQRVAGLAYGQEDAELATQPLTDADNTNIERWMREANVADIEFEEEYEDDTEPAAEKPATRSLTDKQRWWFVGGAVVFVVALALLL